MEEVIGTLDASKNTEYYIERKDDGKLHVIPATEGSYWQLLEKLERYKQALRDAKQELVEPPWDNAPHRAYDIIVAALAEVDA